MNLVYIFQSQNLILEKQTTNVLVDCSSYFVPPRKMGRSTHLGFFLATNTITISLRCRPMYRIIMFWLGNMAAGLYIYIQGGIDIGLPH